MTKPCCSGGLDRGRESRQFWPIQPILRINEEDTINFGITPFRRAPVNARCALKEGGYVFHQFLVALKLTFPQRRKLYELKIVLPLLQDPKPRHVRHLGDGPVRHMQL